MDDREAHKSALHRMAELSAIPLVQVYCRKESQTGHPYTVALAAILSQEMPLIELATQHYGMALEEMRDDLLETCWGDSLENRSLEGLRGRIKEDVLSDFGIAGLIEEGLTDHIDPMKMKEFIEHQCAMEMAGILERATDHDFPKAIAAIKNFKDGEKGLSEFRSTAIIMLEGYSDTYLLADDAE